MARSPREKQNPERLLDDVHKRFATQVLFLHEDFAVILGDAGNEFPFSLFQLGWLARERRAAELGGGDFEFRLGVRWAAGTGVELEHLAEGLVLLRRIGSVEGSLHGGVEAPRAQRRVRSAASRSSLCPRPAADRAGPLRAGLKPGVTLLGGPRVASIQDFKRFVDFAAEAVEIDRVFLLQILQEADWLVLQKL